MVNQPFLNIYAWPNEILETISREKCFDVFNCREITIETSISIFLLISINSDYVTHSAWSLEGNHFQKEPPRSCTVCKGKIDRPYRL